MSSSYAYGASADALAGPIAKTCVAIVESTYDRSAIRRLVAANKQTGMSMYPVADTPETYNVEIDEIVFTSSSRYRQKHLIDAHVKSSLNGEGNEATRLAMRLPASMREDAVMAAVAKNTRYFGVAATGAQFTGTVEDKISVQVAGTATLRRARSARRETIPGDRLYARPALAGPRGLPVTTGDDVDGVPSNKYVMEVHPEDPHVVADMLLKHARLVQYDAALYRQMMGADRDTDALQAATHDLFAFIRLCALAGVRQALRDGELEVAAGAKLRAAATGTAESALLASASRDERADAATAIMAELWGVTQTRRMTPDAETRRIYGLGASKIVDFALHDAETHEVADEFGVTLDATGRPMAKRARYDRNRNAFDTSTTYGALAAEQVVAAKRALQAVAAFHLESEKNYVGKSLGTTNKDGATRVDVFLGAK